MYSRSIIENDLLVKWAICTIDKYQYLVYDKNMNSVKPDKTRLNLHLDSAMVQRARMRAAMDGISIPKVIENALDEYTPKVKMKSVGNKGEMKVEFVLDQNTAGAAVHKPTKQRYSGGVASENDK